MAARQCGAKAKLTNANQTVGGSSVQDGLKQKATIETRSTTSKSTLTRKTENEELLKSIKNAPCGSSLITTGTLAMTALRPIFAVENKEGQTVHVTFQQLKEMEVMEPHLKSLMETQEFQNLEEKEQELFLLRLQANSLIKDSIKNKAIDLQESIYERAKKRKIEQTIRS